VGKRSCQCDDEWPVLVAGDAVTDHDDLFALGSGRMKGEINGFTLRIFDLGNHGRLVAGAFGGG
jgi:hypothetical protein